MSEKLNSNSANSYSGWDDETETKNQVEKKEILETRNLISALDFAAQREEGFTVEVGGNYVDSDGYWQATSFMCESYDKGADTKKIADNIHKTVGYEAVDGDIVADIYAGKLEDSKREMIARAILQ